MFMASHKVFNKTDIANVHMLTILTRVSARATKGMPLLSYASSNVSRHSELRKTNNALPDVNALLDPKSQKW